VVIAVPEHLVCDDGVAIAFGVGLIVTVNEQVFILPAASVAVDTTVVVPTAKTDPDAGTDTTVVPGQLSDATGAAKFTTWLPPHNEIFAGQVMDGSCVSFTVTVNEQVPPPVLLVTFTVVVPTGKNEPDAGDAVTVPHVPVVPGAG
jgi:hypothetical protein